MAKARRVILTGGGTGGHIYPALAIGARVVQRLAPVELLFVGSAGGMEESLVRSEGMDFVGLPVRGMIRKGAMDQVTGAARFGLSLATALGVVHRFHPQVVVGTGGYAAGPMGIAAVVSGTPLLIQEQNVVPGVTNRWLSRFAAAVAVPLPEAARNFPPQAKLLIAGNPVRPELLVADRAACRAALGLGSTEPLVVMVAGSRGSAVFVRLLAEWLPQWERGTLLFVSGRAHAAAAQRVLDEMRDRPHGRVLLVPYAERMGDLLAASDLVVARAGAMTLADLAGVGRPAILIPSPYVTHHHQEANADAFAAAGGALVLPEADLDGRRLGDEVAVLLADRVRLAEMGRRARSLYRADALDRIVRKIETLLRH